MLNALILVTVVWCCTRTSSWVGNTPKCVEAVPPPYSQMVQKKYASRGACVFVCVCGCVCVWRERENDTAYRAKCKQ